MGFTGAVTLAAARQSRHSTPYSALELRHPPEFLMLAAQS